MKFEKFGNKKIKDNKKNEKDLLKNPEKYTNKLDEEMDKYWGNLPTDKSMKFEKNNKI